MSRRLVTTGTICLTKRVYERPMMRPWRIAIDQLPSAPPLQLPQRCGRFTKPRNANSPKGLRLRTDPVAHGSGRTLHTFRSHMLRRRVPPGFRCPGGRARSGSSRGEGARHQRGALRSRCGSEQMSLCSNAVRHIGERRPKRGAIQERLQHLRVGPLAHPECLVVDEDPAVGEPRGRPNR